MCVTVVIPFCYLLKKARKSRNIENSDDIVFVFLLISFYIYIYILFTNTFNQSCFFFAVLMSTNKQAVCKRSLLNYVNDQNIPVSILVSTKSVWD